VTVDGTGKIFTFAGPQTAFGMGVTGTESVDFYDVNMDLLASSVTATRTSDTGFTTTLAVAGAAWVMIRGAPAWYFSDTGQKGDFLTLQTLVDYRTNGEYDRLTSDGSDLSPVDCNGEPISYPDQNYGFASFSQTPGCLPFTPCSPRVICFSPNGETFTNGVTIDFPESFVLDERYGSRWQGYVQQNMTDPLWLEPHYPCAWTNGWQAANLCDADTDDIKYFAHPLQVEARISLPSNYGASADETPGDPFSVYENLPWLSPVTNYGEPDVYSPILYIGFTDAGLPAGTTTPTSLHAALVAAIGSGCRFDYLNEVIP